MKKYIFLSVLAYSIQCTVVGQDSTLIRVEGPALPKEKEALKFNLNESGTHYFQATFLNQTWVRIDQSNPGTMVNGQVQSHTFDIGLRRTRIQLYGQLTDRTFLYFQFGQNNFNSQFNYSANGGLNRKNAPFFHDALGEYKVFRGNELKLGGGLTIVNGLSRFSQPSIGTILTMDVPVFAQTTVDQTDEFSRKLSIYARGQVGKLDYRVVLSDPFPIQSNGAAPPAISPNASFAQKGHTHQFQTYLMYQFFEHENHTTPGYMTGTYLGKKKVFNVAAGFITQPKAMWHQPANGTDTAYSALTHWCIESFLDMPVNKASGTALSAYAGFFHLSFGPNYLRYNGIMNPATSTSNSNSLKGAGATYGNAFPMFGTGQVIYSQFGYLLANNLLGKNGGQLMPYTSWMHGTYDRLQGQSMDVITVGLNWFIKGHSSKLTLDYQNRPTYQTDASGTISRGSRRGSFVLQYQLFI